MKILCLVKPVRVIDSSIIPDTGQKTSLVLNPSDISALEEALKIKDASGCRVDVLSMGAKAAEGQLRELIARGCDEVFLLSDPALAGSDTYATACALSGTIETIGPYDYIFCGYRSADGETGQVGAQIAERLGIRLISRCISMDVLEQYEVKCSIREDGGVFRLKAAGPALITFQNGINSPRLPSLSGLYRAKRAGIHVLGIRDAGLTESCCGQAGSKTIVCSTVFHSIPRRQPERFDAGSLNEACNRISELIL